jgi:hypothetical protein
MTTKIRIIALASAAVLFVSFIPSTVQAQAPDGSITECLELAGGDKDVFLECIEDFRQSLQERYKLSDGWFERLSNFVEEHPNWAATIRGIADRLEDRWDRREDRWDNRENRWDRSENRRDRLEDFLDRWEDRNDEDRNLEDLFDRVEDRRDHREDRWDRRENRFDRRENYRDRFEDWRDGLWPRQD